jgi:hypothetical protein
MSCNRTADLLAYLHNEPEAPAFAGHLSTCPVCQHEFKQLEKLDRLLAENLPRIQISASFQSTFANRLAAEILAEDDGSALGHEWRRFGWLWRPWLAPLAVTAALALIALGFALSSPQLDLSARVARYVGRAPQAVAQRQSTTDKDEDTLASTPKDLQDRTDLFVNYAIISQFDRLDASTAADADGQG